VVVLFISVIDACVVVTGATTLLLLLLTSQGFGGDGIIYKKEKIRKSLCNGEKTEY
jgi:hypothetical protein